jgi:hypothetical protein
METPCDKTTGRKIFNNLFTSSSKLFGNDFFNFNSLSNYSYKDKENIFLQSNQSYNNNPFTQNRNFSFSKIMQGSTCKKSNLNRNLDTIEMIGKKKLRFSECRKIYYDPEEELEGNQARKMNEIITKHENTENIDNIKLKDCTPKEKEILRLNVKSSKFKISNVNFDINFCYMK